MTTKRTTEIGVTFYRAGGHSHDGENSTLIDTSKYSVFDFDLSLSTNGSDSNRELRRQNNKNRFDQYISRFVTSQVLEPAGIVLPAESVRGVNIGANEITAVNIASNTITASEIAAGTITSDLLVSNFVVVNSTISSNNFSYNPNSNTNSGWAIYSNGDAIFNNGIFSGRIDVGGFDSTSFHVATDGSVWVGSGEFSTGTVRITAQGNTVLANGGLTANTNGAVNIAGNLNVSGQSVTLAPAGGGSVLINGSLNVTSGATIEGSSWLYGSTSIALYDNNTSTPGFHVVGLPNSGLGFESPVTGRTIAYINRYVDPSSLPPSHAFQQMLRIRNSSQDKLSARAVAGLACIVGDTSGGVDSLRSGVWRYLGPDNAFAAGSADGGGLITIFASAFTPSSLIYKENVEYMPIESRDISIERIKNLKPARWDEKNSLQEGRLSERFKNINERWQKSGKSALTPQDHHYIFSEHDCSIDNCTGDSENRCPVFERSKKRYGFIAEDVAQVFPKAVAYSSEGNPIAIDYSSITYSLVETVQSLLDKVEYLESRLQELSS